MNIILLNKVIRMLQKQVIRKRIWRFNHRWDDDNDNKNIFFYFTIYGDFFYFDN